MPRITQERTQVSFTGQVHKDTLKAIVELAIEHHVSMAEIVRRLIQVGMECTDQGKTLFTTQRRILL